MLTFISYSHVFNSRVTALVAGDVASAAHIALLAAHGKASNDFSRANVAHHTAENTRY